MGSSAVFRPYLLKVIIVASVSLKLLKPNKYLTFPKNIAVNIIKKTKSIAKSKIDIIVNVI